MAPLLGCLAVGGLPARVWSPIESALGCCSGVTAQNARGHGPAVHARFAARPCRPGGCWPGRGSTRRLRSRWLLGRTISASWMCPPRWPTFWRIAQRWVWGWHHNSGRGMLEKVTGWDFSKALGTGYVCMLGTPCSRSRLLRCAMSPSVAAAGSARPSLATLANGVRRGCESVLPPCAFCARAAVLGVAGAAGEHARWPAAPAGPRLLGAGEAS